MAEARWPKDFGAFSELLLASGLVNESVLRTLTNDFRAQVARQKLPDESLTTFNSYLVGSGFLTCWQCGMLREGRYKGFFLDEFKLLDCFGPDDKVTRFLAVHGLTSQRVVLAVTPYSVARGSNGESLYTVEDYNPDRTS
jgi:hypothetical protein